MDVHKDEIAGTVRITGLLDITVCGALRDALAASLQQGVEVLLDLSEVEACDATALQLLCSAHRSAAATGKTIRLVRPSEAILGMSRTLGISPRDIGVEVTTGGI